MSAASADRPNILLILTDQHRLDAMGCYPHSQGRVQTPNLDRLAETGTLFETAYTVCPLCTPARASVMTGHFPHRHGMTCNSDNVPGNIASALHELTDRPGLLSRTLGRAGYACGYTGKWHIGTEGGQLFDGTTVASLPRDFGFVGHNCPGHGSGGWRFADYKAYLQANGLSYTRRREPGTHYGAAIFDGPDEAHISHYLASYTVDMIDRLAGGDGPWFLWHNFWGPHSPAVAPERWVRHYQAMDWQPWASFADCRPDDLAWQTRRASDEPDWQSWARTIPYYYAFASFIDEQIGRILDHLEARGLAENTLVLFSADHGEYLGAHGGLRDKGRGHYEEIARIPMIVRTPASLVPDASLRQGRRLGQLASNVDLYATVADAAGADVAEVHPHGLSLLEPIRNPAAAWRDDVFMECFGTGHLPQTAFTGRCERYKYGFTFGGRDELYDLAEDPHELCNRIDDPALADVRREMIQRTARWMETTDYHPHGVRDFRLARIGC